MIISARIVKKAKKQKWCSGCGIRLLDRHVDLFGYGEPGDHPYTIHQCIDCATDYARMGNSADQKRLKKALGISSGNRKSSK